MTLRKKILVGFILLLVLQLIVVVLAYSQMKRMGDKAIEIKENWMQSVTTLGELNGNMTDVPRLVSRIGLETDTNEMNKLADQLSQAQRATEKGMSEYETLISSTEEQDLYAEFKEKWADYSAGVPDVINLAQQNRNAEANAKIKVIVLDWNQAKAAIMKLIDLNKNGAFTASETSVSIYHSAALIMMVIGVVALVAGIVAMLIIIRDLKQLSAKISHSADTVASSSEEISASIQEIAEGNQFQATAATSVSSMIDEMSKAITVVAQSSEQASAFADKTSEMAVQGGQMMHDTIVGMNEIKEKVSTLSSISKQIEQITGVIHDIAAQTNLLSLNAAIEAARAGEHGRGFAVVADKVRILADQCGKATKEITALIEMIRENTDHTVDAVNHGDMLVVRAEETFTKIIELIRESAIKVGEIAASSEEQSAQVAEILHSAQNIASVTEQTSAGAEETTSAATELAKMAEQLNVLVLKL